MSNRIVTELDFRMPEFRDAKPEDYEFRGDGKIVRKDRWESGMTSIASALGFSIRGGYEIPHVVQRVQDLFGERAFWHPMGHLADEHLAVATVRLKDGTILTDVAITGKKDLELTWRGVSIALADCTHWREKPDKSLLDFDPIGDDR